MRRKEKEIIQVSEVETVVQRALVCRLGMSDNGMPYVIPLCFGYRDRTVYIHSAREGRKIDILRKNPNVCIEFGADTEIIEAENACEWGIRYRSVIGFGTASFLEDEDEKRQALEVIMAHYSDKPPQFAEKALRHTAIIKVDISEMTGKQSGFGA